MEGRELEGPLETKIDEPVKDEFAEAFDTAQGDGDRPDLSKADDPAKENAGPETSPDEPPGKPAGEVKPPVEEPVKPDASVKQPDSEETWEQRYKTLQGIHKHDRETWETDKTRFLTEIEEAKKPKTPEKQEPTPEQKKVAEDFLDSLTDEEKRQLEEYNQDFDVVSKMEGLKRRGEMAKLRKEFQEWKDEITGKLTIHDGKLTEHETKIAPVLTAAAENEREAHFDLIRDGYVRADGTAVPGHGDFEKYRDDGSLKAWIESKPKYIQNALEETYEKGTAIDVIDLYTDFKRENNITDQPPSNKVVDIKKAEKKQALTAVTSRRGAVNAGFQIADDYEGAFDEAMKR